MSTPLDRDDPYAFETLWRQYRACRRNKRNTVNALRFELNAEENLLALQRELRAHTYRPGPSICFVTTGPKPREVFAADFRDRVVHHVLVSRQEPVFEREFIHDSYACRKGKGTLAANDRLMRFLRQATANGRRPAWFLHLDVASFFPSIHKETLYHLIAARVRHPELRWLTHTVLFHDPTASYRFRSAGGRTPPPGRADYPVPARKSLFGKHNERGLPIGNLTSQFWGNVYLNPLDQFVKRRLGVRWYLRYVDDLLLLANDPARLVAWRTAIAEFLAVRLRLSLRPDAAEPAPVGTGVDFAGWKAWQTHRVPRQRTVAALRRRVRTFERSHAAPVLWGSALRLTARRQNVLALRDAMASYAGHCRHAAAWAVWQRLWRDHVWLAALFRRDGWRFRDRWRDVGRAPRSFGQRYRALLRGAGGQVLVFDRVGTFYEFRGPQRLLAERRLGLRRVWLPRGGFGFAVGFHHAALLRHLRRALAWGMPVLLVRYARTRKASVGPSTNAVISGWRPKCDLRPRHLAPLTRPAYD